MKSSISKLGSLISVAGLCLTLSLPLSSHAREPAKPQTQSISDAALVKRLPGFKSEYANVNGTRLHYVSGGSGPALFLLPGWPQNWWQYNKIMPQLASEFRVIAVDLRGMGGSEKAASGYDKKTLARDIHALARQLGHEKVNIAGHDIGAMVAFSFAANYPEMTSKLALLDVPHPDEFFSELRMLPALGAFGTKIDDKHPGYPWWFAFHQVKELPEKLLEGRTGLYLDFLFDYLLQDSNSLTKEDRNIYKAAFARPGAIRTGNAYYQTFMQDAVDMKGYEKLKMPVLALGGSGGYAWLKAAVPPKANDVTVVKVENSGHFLAEEQPEVVTKLLADFFR